MAPGEAGECFAVNKGAASAVDYEKGRRRTGWEWVA